MSRNLSQNGYGESCVCACVCVYLSVCVCDSGGLQNISSFPPPRPTGKQVEAPLEAHRPRGSIPKKIWIWI